MYEPNWVGHLITNYPPANQLLVYDYAKGGSRVYQVKNQIQIMFNRQIGQKPPWAPWTAEDTLFGEPLSGSVCLILCVHLK